MTTQPDLYAAVCDAYTLQRAWLEVWSGRTWTSRTQGAGVDGVTIASWAGDWPDRLARLGAELEARVYHPSPLLWFDVPRREPGRTRRLGIPTVTDRVVQRAAKSVLEPIWEARFLSCSHGFRPDRSVFTAIAHVLWHEANGRRWVADADIEACFDNISHERLLTQLAEFEDMRLLSLVASWLEVGSVAPGRGVAQGAVISPLLTNIYLHPFDAGMLQAGYALVRYADDFVVLCEDQPSAQRALDDAARLLAELGLALNQEKSHIVRFGPEFTFLGAQFDCGSTNPTKPETGG